MGNKPESELKQWLGEKIKSLTNNELLAALGDIEFPKGEGTYEHIVLTEVMLRLAEDHPDLKAHQLLPSLQAPELEKSDPRDRRIKRIAIISCNRCDKAGLIVYTQAGSALVQSVGQWHTKGPKEWAWIKSRGDENQEYLYCGKCKLEICEHEDVDSSTDTCKNCGAVFIVCRSCSNSGGAERAVRHIPPECGGQRMADYSTHDPKGWCGDPKRGAALGRPAIKGSPDYAGRLVLHKVPLNNGGYDCNGTYFGFGDPLYWCASDDGSIDRMLRARSRTKAREQVLELYPKAKVRR